MSTAKFMTQLREIGVELSVNNDKLVCNAPKGVLTDELRSELSARKAEFITFLQTAATVAANDSKPVAVADRGGNPPLSFAQERLWYLDELEPNSSAYNLPSAVVIDGDLDTEVLQKSLSEIISRYEILRSRFSVEADAPVQLIDAPQPIDLPIFDLTSLQADQKEQAAQDYLLSAAKEPFDLKDGPLIRVACIRLDKSEHILSLMTHHTIFDGTSFGLFLNELGQIYAAYTEGKSSPLTDVPVQYADYAIWQRELIKDAELDRLLSYWREQLSGDLPLLALPTDHARPPVQSYRGSTEIVELPLALADDLTKLGRDHGATLFMVLLAAFNVLLHRYSGQDDIVVGSPINGRNCPELQNSVGFFVNTLALRTDLSGEPTFSELLSKVKDRCLEAYAHQELPFEKLVQELDIQRDMSRTPVFQSMFAYQDTSNRAVSSSDLTFKARRVDTQMSRTDISFWVSRSESGLSTVVEYSADLFEPQSIVQLLGHFKSLLEEISGKPELPIAEIPLLSQDERKQIEVRWNDTKVNFSSSNYVHEMFEEQAKRSPESVAVVCGGDQASYDQLNRRSNQLARHLIAVGVCPGMLVGISMDRSTDMLVGLLAILKAGCAYVPLDPDFPSERLTYMISDAGLKFTVTTDAVWQNLPENDSSAVCIDVESEAIAALEDSNLEASAEQSDLAYVIYTSGSTGKPKGVQVPHHCVANFLNSMQQEPGLDSSDRLLAVTTLSFDIAALELFLPLITGARVVIATRDVAADGARLIETLATEEISVMQATPATWQMMFDAGWDNSLPIKVLCGGEAMLLDLAAELLRRSPSVWNLYGPTETTVWSTCSKIEDADGPVLIGRPIANTEIYILDRLGNPVPVGVSGEIVIGGSGVTDGYVARPELTAEKFIPNSFAESEHKLYRTGDLGRWRSDGLLEHLGRIDSQVKVRGFRIELGEIESVLNEHSSVERVAVNVWEAKPGDQRLVAYIVVADGAAIEPVQLRKHLSARLPQYMLPQHYSKMDAIPLTPNGKVDRKRLPAPETAVDARPQQPPETDTEKQVAAIWSELLGIDQIGRHDNFFELGGHSLLAVKAVLQMESVTGTRIELRQILLEDLSQVAQHVPQSSDGECDASAKPDSLFSKLMSWGRDAS